jgi:3-dehydroquinate synthase
MKIIHSSGEYEVLFQSIDLPKGIIISDQHVAASHPHFFAHNPAIILKSGEKSKSVRSYGNLCQQLAQLGANRKSTLIAFGGGVIGHLHEGHQLHPSPHNASSPN